MEVLDDIYVVKVGSSTLTSNGALDYVTFNGLGDQVNALREADKHVVLVSSGAIAAGIQISNSKPKNEANYAMPDLQRFASIGWRHILNAWDRSIGDAYIGELLLTRNELGMQTEANEAMRVTHNLLSNCCVPIVNENDSICHEEISFGDNDTLAAHLASSIRRSPLFGNNVKLVLLSDIGGVREDPNDTNSSIIPEIVNVKDYYHLAMDTKGLVGTGGMRTKLEAAELVTDLGMDMWIANGKESDVIMRSVAGEIGTHFLSRSASLVTN